jgi:hypothetical protein
MRVVATNDDIENACVTASGSSGTALSSQMSFCTSCESIMLAGVHHINVHTIPVLVLHVCIALHAQIKRCIVVIMFSKVERRMHVCFRSVLSPMPAFPLFSGRSGCRQRQHPVVRAPAVLQITGRIARIYSTCKNRRRKKTDREGVVVALHCIAVCSAAVQTKRTSSLHASRPRVHVSRTNPNRLPCELSSADLACMMDG